MCFRKIWDESEPFRYIALEAGGTQGDRVPQVLRGRKIWPCRKNIIDP